MPQSLIVGANGQVGAAIVSLLGDRALAAGRSVTPHTPAAVDLVSCAQIPGLAQQLLAPLSLDAVYCVGGATDVERCETDTAWAMDTNCHGPAALAAASRHLPFVYFSTDYVFDGHDGPYAEDAPTHPLSVYGRSKLMGEEAVRAAHPSPLIIRTNVVYGPDRQRKNFLYTLDRLLRSGTPMRVPDDQISTPTYNEDLAHAVAALVHGGHTGLFHVSGREVFSRYDFSLVAAEILGLDPTLITPVKTSDLTQKAARPLAAGLRIDKLSAALPSLHLHTTAEAIREWQQHETGNTNLDRRSTHV